MLEETLVSPCVVVKAPARVSFTLLDLNGSSGRRNGMASLAIEEPSFMAIIRPSDDWEFTGREISTGLKQAVIDLLTGLAGSFGSGKVTIEVRSCIPAHAGLGSKTSTMFAVARGYLTSIGATISTLELARLARRGGTSGGGVNLSDLGGYIVDGGHANSDNFLDNPKKYLVPSGFAGTIERLPPVLTRLDFPDWPILLLYGHQSGLSGIAEHEWFQSIVPIPEHEVHFASHLVTFGMGSAIIERDFSRFCKSVCKLTQNGYFKKEQLTIQSPQQRQALERALSFPGIGAAGLSGMGPTVYAFGERIEDLDRLAECLISANLVRSVQLTRARNKGIEVIKSEERQV